MDRQTVYTKTAKGMMEATGKTSVLSRDMRALLKEVDGKATVGDVQAKLGKVPEATLQAALQALVKNDFIREFKQAQTAAPLPSPAEVDIDLDFTTAIPTISALAKKGEEEARQKAQAVAEAAARAQAEAAAKAKAEAEAKAKAAAAAAARARAEAEARARKEAEEAERRAREAAQRARREAEERARREAEEYARAQEAARVEAEARARREAEEAERRAREDAERKAKEEAERARREAEERAQREAEERARREAEERARREAEQQARRAAEEQARREAEEFARAQAAARVEAEARARRQAEEAERRAREDAERKAKEAAERAQREAEEQARREAEEFARAQAAARVEAEARARREAEEAERRAREDAEREAKEAAERAQREAEEQVRREAEEQARREAEEFARAQEAARVEAEARARREAEEAERKAREDAERKAKEAAEHERREAEERARREDEKQARREAEEYARAQEAARREAEEAERKAQEAAERERREDEKQARREAEEYARAQEAARVEAEVRARREAEEAEEAERRAREDAERKAKEAAALERQAAEEQGARESAQTPTPAVESGTSLDDMVRIETDFDAVLGAGGGAAGDAPKSSAGADAKLQEEAEEQARRVAEARAREEADAAAAHAEEERRRKDEEERAQEPVSGETGETARIWDHAEAQALVQAQEAETERHFAEMEKELEAERLAAGGGEEPFEPRELARKREQEEARERESAAAAAHALEAEAALAADAAIEAETPARVRKAVNWGRPAALALFLILVLGLILIPFIPFDGYIPQFEKLAGAYLQQPVKIKTLNLMLLPQPHWRLDDVSIGNQGQLTAARVNAIAELGSMFSDKKVFKSIELESPVLSEEALLALLFGKPLGPDLKVASVIAKNARLDSKTFNLPALDAKITVGERDGTWQTIALETPDHNTSMRLTPDGVGAHLEVTTNALSMPLDPPFTLENFDATGVIRRGELTLSEFKGRIYGGYLSGNASLKWGADWSLNGEIKARAIDPGKFSQKLIEGGSVEGKAVYALQGKSYASLFAAPRLEGSFAVSKGALLGVDLGRFLQGGGVGGKTAFAELTGSFARDAGKTQLRQVHLSSGPLSASGSADTDAGNRISGRFLVEIKSSVAQARANLALSGALGDPLFSR